VGTRRALSLLFKPHRHQRRAAADRGLRADTPHLGRRQGTSGSKFDEPRRKPDPETGRRSVMTDPANPDRTGKPQRVAVIHTSAVTVEPLKALIAELIPAADVVNF